MATIVSYAEPDDAADLALLFKSVVGPLEIYTEAARAAELAKFEAADFTRLIEHASSRVIVARIDGRLSGFAVVEDESGPLWIEWYGVAAEARGRGVGEHLIRFILAEASRTGATRVWCDTLTSNSPSIALFEKLGFRKLCTLPNHWYGQDFFLWESSPL